MPRLTVPDGDPLHEVNHCHGPGSGHPCRPGEGAGKRTAGNKETERILAHIDRYGTKTVQVGRLYRRPFGEREYARLEKLVKAGVLERLPSAGGPTVIQSPAPYMNRKQIGISSEHTYRRKR
jgi:hypothetical protein